MTRLAGWLAGSARLARDCYHILGTLPKPNLSALPTTTQLLNSQTYLIRTWQKIANAEHHTKQHKHSTAPSSRVNKHPPRTKSSWFRHTLHLRICVTPPPLSLSLPRSISCARDRPEMQQCAQHHPPPPRAQPYDRPPQPGLPDVRAARVLCDTGGRGACSRRERERSIGRRFWVDVLIVHMCCICSAMVNGQMGQVPSIYRCSEFVRRGGVGR